MGTPTDLLRKVAGEIGYYAPADPLPGSKYGRWEAAKLGQGWLAGPSTSIWWCAIFISWGLDGLATMPGAPGYNCDTMRNAARAAGMQLVNPRDAKAGDVAFFDWNRNGSLDHTGFLEANKGSYIQTIEGNTSSGAAGSQSAGNGVWRRTRDWSTVGAIIRPRFSVPALPSAILDIRPFQRVLHAGDDNVWGPDTNNRWTALVAASNYGGRKFPFGVKFTQSVVGAAQDGIWGGDSMERHDHTVGLVQDLVRAFHDEIMGPETIGKVNVLHTGSIHTV